MAKKDFSIKVIYKDNNTGSKKIKEVDVNNEVRRLLALEGIYACTSCYDLGAGCNVCASTGFIKDKEC